MHGHKRSSLVAFAGALALGQFAGMGNSVAHGASGNAPDYDFQWSTIGDVNNPAYEGGPFGGNEGRGSVGYEYRISRLEVTSAQFLEFVNTFWEAEGIPLGAWLTGGSSSIIPGFSGPYELVDHPDAPMIPVIGISWRTAAQYCNWLHNGKSNDPTSRLSGAYDVSTFGTNPDGTFTDQLTHSKDAKFWIPTLDEWLKAAHYDPNKGGFGVGGWWESVNGTDEPLVAGPPGVGGGETSGAGNYDWSFDPAGIPLGAYSDVQSPWGLWDLSGGAGEWLEEAYEPGFLVNRGMDGSWAGAALGFATRDLAYATGVFGPEHMVYGGLRVASSVPSPSIVAPIAIWAVFARRRLRGSRM